MTEISFPFRDTILLSPRTMKYIAALFREGDKFDYSRWLQRVREEETQAKQRPLTNAPVERVAAGTGGQTGTSDGIRPKTVLATRAMPIPKASWQARHVPKVKAPQSGIRRWLEKVSNAWNAFQTSRGRDAVYGYLEAVFAIVKHYKVRRKTKELRRYAFNFAELALDRNADPFTAVIRCTSGDAVDNKTISKWARALRYAARCKVRPSELKTFMKRAGGVNACADRYAKVLGRGAR